jgi:hypothetical protein
MHCDALPVGSQILASSTCFAYSAERAPQVGEAPPAAALVLEEASMAPPPAPVVVVAPPAAPLPFARSTTTFPPHDEANSTAAAYHVELGVEVLTFRLEVRSLRAAAGAAF